MIFCTRLEWIVSSNTNIVSVLRTFSTTRMQSEMYCRNKHHWEVPLPTSPAVTLFDGKSTSLITGTIRSLAIALQNLWKTATRHYISYKRPQETLKLPHFIHSIWWANYLSNSTAVDPFTLTPILLQVFRTQAHAPPVEIRSLTS